MRNHTTPKIHELTATSGGKNPTITPGNAQTVTFAMNNVPVGKNGRFWYYVTAIVVKLVTVVDQPSAGSAAINSDKLWKIVQSLQVQCPLLGQLFTHANTSGAAMGNIIQRYGFGFNALHSRAQIPTTDADTTVTLYYRIPFAYEFLKKPHETAPWGGFLEGGTVEVRIAASTVLDGDSTGAVIKATTSLRCWMELIPVPEVCLHAPTHWRLHIIPGSSTRSTIQDMGSSDGLQGIDQSKGVGIASLLYLTDATGIGLGGPDGADNITGIDVPWRDQDRIDSVDAFYVAFEAMQGNARQNRNAVPVPHDGGSWPYTIAATPNGDLNDAQALFFPIVSCGRDFETSKLQTLAGAKDINFQYTSTPSASANLLGQYFLTWDENFMKALAARMAPGSAAELVAKTLNKQSGIYGRGKLAYVRAKLVG